MNNKKTRRVIIIGAGPVGAYTATLLAEKGYSVEIYEEHSKIGVPVQCTGILTSSIYNIISTIPKLAVANTISKININSYDNKINAVTEIDLEKPDTIVFRDKFDALLIKAAAEHEVKVFKEHKFLRVEGKKAIIEFNNKELKKDFDFLVGCDGVNSRVKKIINKDRSKEEEELRKSEYCGIQAVIRTEGAAKEGSEHRTDTFISTRLDNSFAWIVPESKNRLRIGLTAEKNPKSIFNRFIEDIVRGNLKERGFTDYRIEKWQGGFIPVYDPDLTIIGDHIAIIGDAATHVKATTFGGIIPGFQAAKEIAGLIDYSLQNNVSVSTKNKELHIHKELRLHMLMRRIMDQFDQEDFDFITKIASREDIRKILTEIPRDNIRKAINIKNILIALKIGINPVNWKRIIRIKWFLMNNKK